MLTLKTMYSFRNVVDFVITRKLAGLLMFGILMSFARKSVKKLRFVNFPAPMVENLAVALVLCANARQREFSYVMRRNDLPVNKAIFLLNCTE